MSDRPKKKRASPTYTPQFQELWDIHPRGPKPDALAEYQAVTGLAGVPHERLVGALGQYVREKVRPDFHGVHLFRWLRDERWEEYANGNGNGAHAPARRVLR